MSFLATSASDDAIYVKNYPNLSQFLNSILIQIIKCLFFLFQPLFRG
jgi:hypothetical protein